MYYYLSFTKINLYTYYNKNKHKLKKQFTIFIFFLKKTFFTLLLFFWLVLCKDIKFQLPLTHS
jgi:hypothetical protein